MLNGIGGKAGGLGAGDLADTLVRGLETATARGRRALFEPVIRLGVTGLSRAGKTVFITSLVANLLNRGRMPQLGADIEAAVLQPQPDDTVPRFAYETHLAALTGPAPHWPQSTRAVSQLRLSFRVRPAGLLAGLSGPRRVHLDIIDYPGEWLLDLALLDQNYADWSAATLARMERLGGGADFIARAAGMAGSSPFEEPGAEALARLFTTWLASARDRGFSGTAPGRFLLPGELEGSPALTFAPLPRPAGSPPRRGIWREFERRYNAYRSQVVKPFFRAHFARIDRQVVLVDMLGAIHAGPAAVEDMRLTLAELLRVFRPGRNSWLSRLGGRRVERILFAATKADHLHHGQHPRLSAIAAALLTEARERADFAGARTGAMAIAALRATVEEERMHKGRKLPCVRGLLEESGRPAAFYPGELPEDPARLLVPAAEGATRWLDADYGSMRFRPPPLDLRPGEGPPHIRLDRAAEFLIGDRLR